MFSDQFMKSVFFAVACASASLAAPWPASCKHTTHRVRSISRDLTVETYHPESTYETYAEGIDHPLSKRDNVSFQEAAVSFVESKTGIDASNLAVKSSFQGDITAHAYIRQQHEDVPFANAVANVALKDNKSISLDDAIAKAEAAIDGNYNDIPTTVEYLAKDDGSVVLTHVIQIQNAATGAAYEAFIDAHSGDLVSVTDFVAKLTYKVLPITKQNITEGVETLTNPENPKSSPDGWVTSNATAGNNVISYKSDTSATTSESSTDAFIYTQDPSEAPTLSDNLDAARTNAFYIVNTVHDINYQYGFTEASYNFQKDNFGLGGAGDDPVLASIQDSLTTDNAAFTTFPDGQSGIMRMFLWDETSPERDGALENDIVVHENTHGTSNRLTGGGTARCLQTTEAGGMGEGWSDAMAEWTEQKSATITDFTLGSYVTNNSAGLRSHPYSTNKTVNPLTYASVASLNEVHDIGEVWATILHEVYAQLVTTYGWSATAQTDASGSEGNVVFLHLFIDALAIQPCNPTLPTGRDAWIQADVNRYGGAHTCALWKGFAARGLGQGAANYEDSSTIPSDC